ncbi:MAG: hypothetical protein ACTSP1_09825 [Candidatus Freyarchaeota archaeon]
MQIIPRRSFGSSSIIPGGSLDKFLQGLLKSFTQRVINVPPNSELDWRKTVEQTLLL